MFEYKTIDTPIENTLFKEKGSKFIGFAFPVTDEAELKKALEKVRGEHLKATHHCYAFRIGIHGENYRANDDGEPSGSAGLPIFNQLLANDITNVLLVVVRYYGGTKLGVSGLVKAYKESAKITLEKALIVTKNWRQKLKSVLISISKTRFLPCFRNSRQRSSTSIHRKERLLQPK